MRSTETAVENVDIDIPDPNHTGELTTKAVAVAQEKDTKESAAKAMEVAQEATKKTETATKESASKESSAKTAAQEKATKAQETTAKEKATKESASKESSAKTQEKATKETAQKSVPVNVPCCCTANQGGWWGIYSGCTAGATSCGNYQYKLCSACWSFID